jgi:hypothetical protein
MPSSGMVREIEERRFPRPLYWDVLVNEIGGTAIRTNGHPAFDGFICPDGSHLDYRDRARFTLALARELGFSPIAAKRTAYKQN